MYVLPLVEAQCEAALKKNAHHGLGAAIAKALNCPNDCFGSGTCLQHGCICYPGFFGHDCKFGTAANLDYSVKIDTSLTPRLCEIGSSTCGAIAIFGVGLSGKSSCFYFYKEGEKQQGMLKLASDNRAACEIKPQIGDVVIAVEDDRGFKDEIKVKIYDGRCEHCQVVNDEPYCKPIEGICQHELGCTGSGQPHPGDKCLHCIQGSWLPKSDGFVSMATSELNKKFKVIMGDFFTYDLPNIDNATVFELTSGPYGSSLSSNGTLRWQAKSNLIDDTWNELFIIKAKSVCNDFTLIEITVHVVSCDCLNGATCLLVHDQPACLCKSGYKGKKFLVWPSFLQHL